MRIDIEDINKHLEFRKKVNCNELDNIEFYENGKKVEIPKEIADEFKYTGLSNIDFISSGYYQKGDYEHKSPCYEDNVN
ncbi:MAG: hypothetical protein GY870_04715 [archaeon]|nr:hypothetical protein [archaeon]